MKRSKKTAPILFIVAVLVMQIACAQILTKKPTIDKSKFLSHVTLTVPETKARISFDAMHNATVDYTDGKAPYVEHGMIILLTDYFVPILGKGFVTVLAVNHGGSGTEIYVVGFVPDKIGYKMQGCFLLGDRVKVTMLKIDHKNNVIIGYKTHADNQPMFEEPTLLVVKKIGLDALIKTHCGS